MSFLKGSCACSYLAKLTNLAERSSSILRLGSQAHLLPCAAPCHIGDGIRPGGTKKDQKSAKSPSSPLLRASRHFIGSDFVGLLRNYSSKPLRAVMCTASHETRMSLAAAQLNN